MIKDVLVVSREALVAIQSNNEFAPNQFQGINLFLTNTAKIDFGSHVKNICEYWAEPSITIEQLQSSLRQLAVLCNAHPMYMTPQLRHIAYVVDILQSHRRSSYHRFTFTIE